MQTALKGQRQLYISVMNVAACFCVIVLHTNSIFWAHPSGSLWITSNFLETICCWAVPVFFMISGATLLDYRERYDTRTFLKKRFRKTVIPFLFWSFIAGLYTSAMAGEPFDWNPLHVIDNILNCRYFSIYWFFLPLFAVYLSIPVLSLAGDRVALCRYGALCGLVFTCAAPLVCRLAGISYNGSLTPPVVGGKLVCVFLGYYLSHTDISRRRRLLLYAVGFAGWLTHFAGTIALSAGKEEIDGTFKGETNLPSVLFACAVFVWFRYRDYGRVTTRHPRWESLLYTVSGLTFGIYLIHFFLVTGATWRFTFNVGSLVWRLGGAVVIFLISALLVYGMKKIPVVRELVP